MIGIIAAVTQNGVIGIDGKLPFDYPEDMKHFRKTTAGATVIMGRKTFDSIGRPLPKRTNIVVSSNKINVDGIITCDSLELAIDMAPYPLAALESDNVDRNIWLIGGASIYEEGMKFANKIVLTLTHAYESSSRAIRFPWVNPSLFELQSIEPMADSPSNLKIATYIKR